MDIAALLLACSVHPDDSLLASIVFVHARGNPYAVLDVRPESLDVTDALGLDIAPDSLPIAQAAVERIQRAGGIPVFGLLPARPEWAVEFGIPWVRLLDACTNVQVASAKLSELDYECRASGLRFDTPARRACTLDHYGAHLVLPALRRAVLADLTLPTAFPTSSEGMRAAAATSLPATNELFFVVGAVAPPPLSPLPTIDGGEPREPPR